MRIVFMGTPEIGVETLRMLAVERDVVAVYTRKDTASRRGNKLFPPPIKEAALDLGLSVHQPATLRDPEEIERLRDLRPDVIVVVAYGMILPPEVLAIPTLGCINIHASLLPRWRGAAPIQRAILAGDERTGVSIMRMEDGLDTGPYCDMVSIPIEDTDTTKTLMSKLAKLGAAALSTSLFKLERGEIVWTPQDDSQATYAEKISKDEVRLRPDLTVDENLRRVRASSNQAPARCRIGETNVRVVSAYPSTEETAESLEQVESLSPGSVCATRKALLLVCADGVLCLGDIIPEGKKAMEATTWARGLREPLESWNVLRTESN